MATTNYSFGDLIQLAIAFAIGLMKPPKITSFGSLVYSFGSLITRLVVLK